MRGYKHLEYKLHIAYIWAPNITGIQFRAVGAGAAAAALLGLAMFGSKSCNFIPSPHTPLSGGEACPHTLHAPCNSTAPVSFKTGSQTNRKLLPMQLQYVCSLGPGSMCNSYNVVHVLTFWCNYICNAPPKGLTVGNY